MPVIVPRLSSLVLMGGLASVFDTWGLRARAFQNDLLPSVATTLADLVEATFNGYAPILFPPSNPPVLVDPGADLTWTVPLTWIVTSSGGPPNVLWGWYVTDGWGRLLWVRRADNAPFNMVSAGDSADMDTPDFWGRSIEEQTTL